MTDIDALALARHELLIVCRIGDLPQDVADACEEVRDGLDNVDQAAAAALKFARVWG